jgi:S1-C subfamily serine protease
MAILTKNRKAGAVSGCWLLDTASTEKGRQLTALSGGTEFSEATGDILLAVDGVPVTGADDLVRLLDAEKINRTIPLDVLRRSDGRRFWAALRERK